jgi:hypothetical protein
MALELKVEKKELRLFLHRSRLFDGVGFGGSTVFSCNQNGC